MLELTYARVRRSIVAFVPMFDTKPCELPRQRFAHIIGTGVIVHEDGLIATNDHVIDAFSRQICPPEFQDIPVVALLFVMTPAGQIEVPLEVEGVVKLRSMEPAGAYYGPPIPDMGFVHVRARKLPALKVDGTSPVMEGKRVATAGFPMGRDLLGAPGWVHQISPTLQEGIVSAIHPFPCAAPHGYTINVMVQGGASGSPVFDPQTGNVIGLVYASPFEPFVSDGDTGRPPKVIPLPTNFTFVVAGRFLEHGVGEAMKREEITSGAQKFRSLDEMLGAAKYQSAVTGDAVDSPLVANLTAPPEPPSNMD